MTRDFSQFFSTSSGAAESAPDPLTALGWRSSFLQQVTPEALADTPPHRIVEVHRGHVQLRGAGGERTSPPIAGATVGDWVLWSPDTPNDALLLERFSLFKRRAPGSDRQEQLIAANVDTAFLVTSCNNDFNIARLERYAALTLEAGATPVIVLTKPDLSDTDTVEDLRAQAAEISRDIVVLAVNAKDTDATQRALEPWCTTGQTIVFLGSSGVGKSTLVNAVLGQTKAETQGIREDDSKGRHTTTVRQLHLAGTGCAVIDTPGMRELQLTDAAEGISTLFDDLEELATHCKFRNCAHDSEPGCAVQAAIAAGDLGADRLARWQKLVREEAFNAASLHERRAKDKDFGKMVKTVMSAKKKRR